MPNNQTPAAFITGLFETHLRVANLERSMHFYEQVLGLQLGVKDEARRGAIYWVGGWGRAFLGLWEKPPNKDFRPWRKDEILKEHLSFRVAPENLDRAIAALKRKGIEVRNNSGERTDVPNVFAWMPAAAVFFDDPDGHLLELLAMLPDKPKPEIGIVSLEEWNRLRGSPAEPERGA